MNINKEIYEIIIVEPSHINLNIDRKYFNQLGENIISALAIKTALIEDDNIDFKKNHDKGFNSSYVDMMDALIYFSNEEIKTFLAKYLPVVKYTTETFCYDNNDVLSKLIGLKLLVEEIDIIDWRDDEDEIVYDPDDYEYILKFINVV
jgi:hypothetical protein